MVDNCGPHRTEVVARAFQEIDWAVMFSPPNMTDILQPMDLVFNSMIKSFMRKQRIEMTMDYFQIFRNLCLQTQRNNPAAELPLFNPPAPVLLDGIRAMFQVRESFERQDFKHSVKRIFQSVGLAPIITSSYQMEFL